MSPWRKKHRLSRLLLAILSTAMLAACVSSPVPSRSFPTTIPPTTASALPSVTYAPSTAPTTPVYRYSVAAVYPHDPSSYTEGLVYADGYLYESSGLYGQSELRQEVLATGKVTETHELPSVYFAEGLTIWDDSLVQLTWESRVGFVYNLQTFALREVFSYATEGWGLTHDDSRLIMSDGTSRLYFWDPSTFRTLGSIEVSDQGHPVDKLNELEYIGGQVYANVFQSDRVAIINPQTGKVTAWLDLSGLLASLNFKGNVDVLNGIAYDEQNNRIFVTGKLWPYLFQIKIRD
jgi:glutamine cyclotransferase